MAALSLPDTDYLSECFSYNRQTGTLIWLERPAAHFQSITTRRQWNSRHALKEAGTLRVDGYRIIKLGAVRFLAHRLIWKMVTGTDPPDEIDHRDRDASNNKWRNLRAATGTQQSANKRLRSDNTSGVKGACWLPKRRCWIVYVWTGRKQHYVGMFKRLADAKSAYRAAARERFGEFWSDGT